MTISGTFDYSVVLPCLNEEKTLAKCILEARDGALRAGLDIQIIVADNGSTDNSVSIAKSLDALVVKVPIRGYGAAIDAGIRISDSDFIVIADSDMSYDLSLAPIFVSELKKNGADLVIGNRFAGGIEPGAMPLHHKYFGNPVLSLLGRLFFHLPIRDFHCGMRAVRKETYLKASPVTKGMEYATEMVIRFANIDAVILEIPTVLRKDMRGRKPHLRSFPDGWRHLKMMLLYSPHFFLLLPGLALGAASLYIISTLTYFGFVDFGIAKGDIQTSFFGLMLYMVSLQLIAASFISMAYAKSKGINRFNAWNKLELILTSRRFIAIGTLVAFIGISGLIIITGTWIVSAYPSVSPITGARRTLPFIVLAATGIQSIICSIQVRQLLSRFW